MSVCMLGRGVYVRRFLVALGTAVLCVAPTDGLAQTTLYHLHSESSTTVDHGQLLGVGPDAASTDLQSVDLRYLPTGAAAIKSFDTHVGVPNATGTIAWGSEVTFALWMRTTAPGGTSFPTATIRLNGEGGTLLCAATGNTPLTTTTSKHSFSCATGDQIQIVPSDRWWISVGVLVSEPPDGDEVHAALHLEGTLDGHYDSTVSVPPVTPVAPELSDFSPVVGAPGTVVTLEGIHFGAVQGSSTVTFNGTAAVPTVWESARIVVPVPAGAATGPVVITTSAGASNAFTFTVSVPGTLSGTVTSTSTAQGIGAAVAQLSRSGVVQGTRMTEADGTYSFGTLPSGSYALHVSAAGYLTALRADVVVGGGVATSIDVALGAPGTLNGRVTQIDGMTGIPGASIRLASDAGDRAALSDATGSYTITDLVAGSYRVEASAGGYSSGVQSGVVVSAGATASADFTLGTSGAATIQYSYDEEGRLVAVTDHNGDMARFGYDRVGNVLSIDRLSAGGLAIVDFSPDRGAVGATVTLSGAGFSPLPAQNAVSFNGTAAAVIFSSPTSLVTTVPAGALTGPIGITVGGHSGTSLTPFEVTAGSSEPIVTGFTPRIGVVGTPVTIAGSGFSATAAGNLVEFNNGVKPASSASASAVVVSAPASVVSGRLAVVTAFGRSVSQDDFFVAPSPYTGADVDFTTRLTLGQPTLIPTPTTSKIQMAVFEASAGQRLALQFTSITNGMRQFSLRNPNGQYVIPTQIGTAYIERTVPLTGTYAFASMPGGLTGSWTLTVHSAADVTTTISPGGAAVPVQLVTPSQNARLTFTGTAGHAVSVGLSGVTIATSDLSILKPDGSLLGTSQFVNTATAFFDGRTLPVSGDYAVVLDPRLGNVGNATVTLHDSTDVVAAIAANGTATPIATGTPGQNARLTFAATAGQRVSLKATASSYGAAFTCGAAISLLDPSGASLALGTCLQTGQEKFIDTVVLPTAGTYTVLVDPASTNTGGVTVTLYTVPADHSGTITPGVALTVPAITVPGQNASYTFQGTATARVSLNVSSSTINCAVVAILRPDSSVLSTRTMCPTGFVEPLTLSVSGTHTVLVDPQGTKTGTLTMTLYNVPADASGTLTPGAPVTVSLAAPGQNARYTFSGVDQQRVSVQVAGSTFSCASIWLRNPSEGTVGNTTACGATGFIDTKTLPTTGTFSVAVDPTNQAVGQLTLTLHTVPADASATATIGGGAVTVTASVPGQNAAVSFAATQGQRVTITGTSNSMGCPTVKLLRPDGTQQAITTPCGATFTLSNQTLSTTGTYTLTVDPSSVNTGSVTISISAS
jgi:YD repeat-containing protein